jgi:predicted aminopeptidase
MLKRLGLFVAFLSNTLGLYNCSSIKYALAQAGGQWKVLRKAVPVKQLLADPNLPDSTKQKLLLIGQIRQFAIDSLGLKDTKNYQKLYEQHGKPILKLVIASDKYQLKALQWKFPIIGSFDYKGFFDFEEADKLEKELQHKGYDTQISDVAAWSTLGWFKDPILSSMLDYDIGSLADLIIHEMVHSTIFIKNNHELNENLANFIAKYGAEAFLIHKFGLEANELKEFKDELQFSDQLEQLLVLQSAQLQVFYNEPSFLVAQQKDSLKLGFLKNLKLKRDSLFEAYQRVPKRNILPNNAYYVGYLTYHAKQKSFDKELNTKYLGNFKAYLKELKNRYPQK